MGLSAIGRGWVAGVLLSAAGGLAQGIDLRGNHVDPVGTRNRAVTVLVFVRSDCPISNRYAPEILRLHREYEGRGVRFWIIYPGNTVEEVNKHFTEYGYAQSGDRAIGVLMDPKRALVKQSKVLVTPEAAVFARGRLEYHGRIDDRFLNFGRGRTQAKDHDLERVLDAVLAGKPSPERTARAAGCYISDLK